MIPAGIVERFLFGMMAIVSILRVKSKDVLGYQMDDFEDSHIFRFSMRPDVENDVNVYNALKILFQKEESVKFEMEFCALSDLSCDFKVKRSSRQRPDRSCLISPPSADNRVEEEYFAPMDIESLTNFINEGAKTFVGLDGRVSDLGKFVHEISNHQDVISHEYSCSKISYDDFSRNPNEFIRNVWMKQRPVVITGFPTVDGRHLLRILHNFNNKKVGVKLSPDVEFEGIDSLLNWDMAKTQYVPPSVLDKMQSPDKVVVRALHEELLIRDVLDIMSWSSTNADARGVSTLQCTSMNSTACVSPSTVNAYIEYLNMWGVLQSLLAALLPTPNADPNYVGLPTWLHDVMLEGKPHLWMGDGRTVGKLHFDPFDNILVQVEGSKTFLMADASRNERLYEGHMREAELSLDDSSSVSVSVPMPSPPPWAPSTHAEENRENSTAAFERWLRMSRGLQLATSAKFRKHTLSESTSMVHSPVGDLSAPDAERYPLSQDLNGRLVSCTVEAGQALFVPSFWWHEVASAPGPPRPYTRANGHTDEILSARKEGVEANGGVGDTTSVNGLSIQMNVAVNFWFAPLFDKEFPCATCRKTFNPKYRRVMQRLLEREREQEGP